MRKVGMMLETVLYWLVRGGLGALGLIPHQLRTAVLGRILRVLVALHSPTKRIMLRNLTLAFPDESAEFYDALITRTCVSFARAISDTIRLFCLDQEWVREHVEIPFYDRYLELRAANPNKGILFVTGHLGSFDLLAYSAGLLGHSLNVVARRFKNRLLDGWFSGIRERTGNKVIDRSGATRKMLSAVNSGENVGILFDQNVTRKHAIFIDWFGRLAATTFAPGYVAVTTECQVMVVYLHYLGGDRYQMRAEEIELADVYHDDTKSRDDKIREVLERCTAVFMKMIIASPDEWFWFHRRWKTTPEGVPEDFYKG